MRSRNLLVATVVVGFVVSLPFDDVAAEGLSPSAQRGLTYMQAHCASCHSIAKAGDSPLKLAPPFRTLHLKYPVETLEEALGEGIVTGHPSMPEFRLDPGQVGDVMAYLKWLER